MNDEKGVSESWRKTTTVEIQLNWWLDRQIDRDKDREGGRERERKRDIYTDSILPPIFLWWYNNPSSSHICPRICRSNSVLVKYKIQLYKKGRSEAGKWEKKIPKEITCIFERAGRKEENRVCSTKAAVSNGSMEPGANICSPASPGWPNHPVICASKASLLF